MIVDPDETLAQIRALTDPANPRSLLEDEAPRLVELITDLDGWLTGGGVLPRAWYVQRERRSQ